MIFPRMYAFDASHTDDICDVDPMLILKNDLSSSDKVLLNISSCSSV